MCTRVCIIYIYIYITLATTHPTGVYVCMCVCVCLGQVVAKVYTNWLCRYLDLKNEINTCVLILF